jgi:phage tail-like protein
MNLRNILTTHNNRTMAEDPLKTFNFLVEIDGFARFGFAKCSPLSSDTTVIEYGEGGTNTTVQKAPGKTTYPDITLERGQILAAGAGDEDILAWSNQVFNISKKGPSGSATFRRDVTIVQLNNDGSEAKRWEVYQCWPKGHRPFSELDFNSNNNSMQQMILVIEGFKPV